MWLKSSTFAAYFKNFIMMIDYFDVCKAVLSYDDVNAELNRKKRFEYKKYGRMSTLEWLCRNYLHTHVVENFSLVEWKKFRVKTSLLAAMVKWIADKETSFRVLVYFCEHPYDVLSEDYLNECKDEPELFMDECCKLSDKIFHPWQYMRLLLTRGGKYEPIIGNEYVPDLESAGGAKEKKPVIENSPGYIIGAKKESVWARNGVLKKNPLYDHIYLEYINRAIPYNPHVLFSDSSVLEVILIVRMDIELEVKKLVKCPNNTFSRLRINQFQHIDCIVNRIRLLLNKEENRRLYHKKEPIIKVLFGLYAYLETDEFEAQEKEMITPIIEIIRTYIINNSPNDSIMDILNECVLAFKEEAQRRIEDDLSKEKERADALTVGKIKHDAQHIHNNRDLRIKKLSEVNTELRANLEIRFKGETVQWFWIYRMMADSYIYEHPAYQAFFDELKEAGIDVTKINKSLFTKYYEKVAGDFTLNGWTPRKGMRQSTIDKGEKIAKAARSILYRKN